jgi:hypothetical protein
MEGAPTPAGFCHKCGATSPPERSFCARCGTRLHFASANETVCWNCGTRTEGGETSFCGNCGVPVGGGPTPTMPGTPGRGAPPPELAPRRGRSRTPAAPRSAAWILVVLLLAALVVVSGLLVTGYGDRLLGRTFYVGANPPPTNVTVVAVNVTEVLTLNSTGQTVDDPTTVVPTGAPLYDAGGRPFAINIPIENNVAGTNLTVRSVSAGVDCRISAISPGPPVVVAAGKSVEMELTLIATGGPGFYVLDIFVDATLS